jgi:hypothetical protein
MKTTEAPARAMGEVGVHNWEMQVRWWRAEKKGVEG